MNTKTGVRTTPGCRHQNLEGNTTAHTTERTASHMTCVAVLPARGGSKGIPRKNLKLFLGKPLLAWQVQACLQSKVFDEVYVSTEDEEIAEVAKELGAKVHVRSPEAAADTASSEMVLLEFLEWMVRKGEKPTYVCMPQATSPLTLPEDYQKAYEMLTHNDADSVLSVCREHVFLWRPQQEGKYLHAHNYAPQTRPRRQDWEGELIENGAFYMSKVDVVLRDQCRLGSKVLAVEMPKHRSVDIDAADDFKVCEVLGALHGFGAT